MKKFKFEYLYYLVLICFTAYLLLDTFVIPRYKQDAGGEAAITFAPIEQAVVTPEAEATPSPTPTYDYDNGKVQIIMSQYREYDTNIYVAEVWVNSIEYIKAAFANGAYGKNIKSKTSKIAENNNAILAINGDFYGAREQGYVIRNGILYRDKAGEDRQDLVILSDGSFLIVNERDYTAEELLELGAWQVFSFGPGLLVDGEITVEAGQEVDISMASNPRTAIGVAENGHYFFVVSDGRTTESSGLSLLQLAEFMKSLGADTAYNLDGGGSSTMYFDGQVINKPTTSGTIKERNVSDIVYIGR